MEGLALGIAILILLIVSGVPIAMGFGLLALFLIFWFNMDPSFLMPTAYYRLNSVVILAIPFFIMIGSLMSASGLSTRLVDFANAFVGRLKGGLGTVVIVVSAMFGAIGGTCSAAVAAVGTTMIPKMMESGYPRGHATALVACASILGQLIPPSVPMILFALVTLQSVPACWLATVLPGITVVISYSILNYFMLRNIPTIVLPPRVNFRTQVKMITKTGFRASAPILLAALILGGVYGGVFTPSESACIGVVYIIAFILITKVIPVKKLLGSIIESATISGVLLIMLFFVIIVSRIFTLAKIPHEMVSLALGISSNKYIVLLMVNVFLIMLGMIMDDASGSLLAGALLLPIMEKIGVHPLHFAAIVGVNLGLGNVTPPCAPILYLASRIGDCGIEEYIKPALTLMWGGMLPIVLLTTYWPELPLFLPRLAGYVH